MPFTEFHSLLRGLTVEFCYNADMPTDDIIINPTTDLFIASLWSAPKNEAILCSLLSGVMTNIGEPPVVSAKVLNPLNVQEFAVDKQVRLDVLVEDEAGTFYNVEVQRETHTGFFDRMLLYWGKTYGTQLQIGERYSLLRPVRSIIITEFPVFPNLKDLHAVFELRARENPEVLFSKHCQIHVLRLGDLMRNNLVGLDQFVLDLQRWMQFWAFGSKFEEEKMSTLLQDCPPVLAAYEEYKQFISDPAMREKARARERFLIDLHLDINEAFADGEKKGMEKGIEKGEAKKARETAQILVRMGLPPSDIAKATGLPLSEIESMRKK
jgi:predicted transposase/invertase (TIGR01784 family)